MLCPSRCGRVRGWAVWHVLAVCLAHVAAFPPPPPSDHASRGARNNNSCNPIFWTRGRDVTRCACQWLLSLYAEK